VVPVVVVVVIVPVVVVAVVLLIPMMIVFDAAVRAIPISAIVAAAFMAPCDPMRTRIRRTRPVTGVPNVAAIYRIPVAINPHVVRPW